MPIVPLFTVAGSVMLAIVFELSTGMAAVDVVPSVYVICTVPDLPALTALPRYPIDNASAERWLGCLVLMARSSLRRSGTHGWPFVRPSAIDNDIIA
jgi:hypothetical protein